MRQKVGEDGFLLFCNLRI